MLEIKVQVPDQLLRDRNRWLRLREILVGGDVELADEPGVPATAATPEPSPEPAGSPGSTTLPRLLSNLQKAAYALAQLHKESPCPSGYTARQMALFLREQNIDALSPEQLSWALATLVARHPQDKVFVRRVRRGRYLPTEYTPELFA